MRLREVKLLRACCSLLLAVGGVSLAAALAGCGAYSQPQDPPDPPPGPVAFRVETFLSGQNFPVTMAFAPDGRLFFNELLTGRIRVVENGALRATPWATLTVHASGERGLLGLAFHPQFASNRLVYVFYSDPSGVNRVVRFTEANGVGTAPEIVVDNLPSTSIHNGGNIAFGPSGHLFVTLGDANVPANSQSQSSLSGKILRYNADGSVPADNPFGAGNPVFNLGLRNSFDFTFHPTSGAIYASENGPQCDDEINRVVAAANYGWRTAYPCGDNDPNFAAALIRFNPVIAPTGITFYTRNVFPQFTGSLLMVDFNEGALRRFVVNEANQGQIMASETIVTGRGNLLDVVQGPDGYIYFSSTTDIQRLLPQ